MVPSQKRILRTWQDHKIGPNPREQRSSFHCHGIVQSEGQKSLYLAAPPYEFEPDDFVLVKDYCNNLCTAANDISNHFRLLDGEYSKLVDCRFLVHSEEYTDESAVRRANDILRRLPEFPPELSLGSERSLELESVGRGYFTVGLQRKGTDEMVERVWESMQVSCQMSTNVVRMALLLAQGRPNVPSWKNLRRLGNTTAELLEEVNELANAAINPSQREAWFVVQAFLGSSWQRVTMLFFWHALRCQVEAGYDFEENKYLDIEGISFSMQVFARTSLHSGSSPSIPKYMCNWAYRLLWTERSSATLDFRRFHERFSSLFKNRQARCVGIEQCDGRSPENCKRFKGATIEKPPTEL